MYYINVEGEHVNFDPIRDIADAIDIQLDPDQLGALVLEVVPGSSCLVFCPTKKNCQNVALLLAKYLQRLILCTGKGYTDLPYSLESGGRGGGGNFSSNQNPYV